MARGSLELNMDAKTGPFRWTVVGRADREVLTHYERELQNLARTNTPGGPGSSMLSQYNQTQLREYFVDFDIGEHAHFRVGKQEVAWGETDFFHPTDLINGFDYRWRSFLERDNDELRKPLIMVNGNFDVPALNGSLQLLVRPGIDQLADIGNTYELSGGRWAGQPFKGIDFLAPGSLTVNYRHRNGNATDVTGGARWTGLAGSVNYAVSYLNTYRPDPIVNSAFVPWGEKPKGTLGDFIFPKINVFGASVSTEVPAIDSVVAAEVAYQKNVPFNVGSNFANGALPGFGGVITKDVVVSSLRIDKQFRLMQLLGTSEATLASLQIFDTWIRNLNNSDDIVYAAGYGKKAKRHTTTLTGFFTLNYMNSRLNPGFAAGMDISNGDAFVIPSIEYKVGNHWRFLAEADIFFPHHQKHPGEIEYSTGPLGGLANNDQLMLRATYQF
ncbi:LysR family transcriptional regulator [Burkholderia sp. Bp9142]|nr:LysR family transcriptional regulator [Burkholderia sp. Bp9142]